MILQHIPETTHQISSKLPEFYRRYYRKHFGLFFLDTLYIHLQTVSAGKHTSFPTRKRRRLNRSRAVVRLGNTLANHHSPATNKTTLFPVDDTCMRVIHVLYNCRWVGSASATRVLPLRWTQLLGVDRLNTKALVTTTTGKMATVVLSPFSPSHMLVAKTNSTTRAVPSDVLKKARALFLSWNTRKLKTCQFLCLYLFLNFYLRCEFLKLQRRLIRIAEAILASFFDSFQTAVYYTL